MNPMLLLLLPSSIVVAALLTHLMRRISWAYGVWGIDYHKVDKPKIPEMCGASILITLLIFSAILFYLNEMSGDYVLAFILAIALAGAVGAVDDVKKLKGIYKPLFSLIAGLPLVYLHTYYPSLRIPLFGGFYLPIIYPIAIPIAVSVTANSVNMLDVLNGSMAGSASIVSMGILVSALILGREEAAIYSLILLGSLVGFLYFNRYPSKAFSGNIGSLTVGTTLGVIAIQGGLEMVVLTAMFPYIQNSFYFLFKVKRFAEHREVKVRPTKVLDNGLLEASTDDEAPLTLVRLILAKEPLNERDVVNRIFTIFLVSTLFSIVTVVLMVV